MTAISGANESGKTMILEMVRYSLWGTKALRGVPAEPVVGAKCVSVSDDERAAGLTLWVRAAITRCAT